MLLEKLLFIFFDMWPKSEYSDSCHTVYRNQEIFCNVTGKFWKVAETEQEISEVAGA